MPFPETFTTTRLTAERLRPQHFAAIRAMDSDPAYMALLGGPRSALEQLNKALDRYPKYSRAYSYRGEYFYANGNPSDAQRSYQVGSSSFRISSGRVAILIDGARQ